MPLLVQPTDLRGSVQWSRQLSQDMDQSHGEYGTDDCFHDQARSGHSQVDPAASQTTGPYTKPEPGAAEQVDGESCAVSCPIR